MTARTDGYTLGLLAYELLAGQPVSDGRSSEELGPPWRWSFPRLDCTVAVLAVLLATALFLASFSRAGLSSPPNPTATAAGKASPDVVGRKLGDAIETLRAAGYAAVAWDVGQGSGGSCAVVRQDPPAGTAITAKETATLYYVAGKDCTKKGG